MVHMIIWSSLKWKWVGMGSLNIGASQQVFVGLVKAACCYFPHQSSSLSTDLLPLMGHLFLCLEAHEDHPTTPKVCLAKIDKILENEE